MDRCLFVKRLFRSSAKLVDGEVRNVGQYQNVQPYLLNVILVQGRNHERFLEFDGMECDCKRATCPS